MQLEFSLISELFAIVNLFTTSYWAFKLCSGAHFPVLVSLIIAESLLAKVTVKLLRVQMLLDEPANRT